MTAIFAPIRMIEDQLAASVARDGIFFAGDPGARILSAATRRNGAPSLMPEAWKAELGPDWAQVWHTWHHREREDGG